jgi:hypothetical protein
MKNMRESFSAQSGSMYVTKQKTSGIEAARDRPELETLVFDSVIRELEAFFDGGHLGQGLIESERREIASRVSRAVMTTAATWQRN